MVGPGGDEHGERLGRILTALAARNGSASLAERLCYAAVGVMQQRAIQQAQVTVEQLQVALTSRIMIEQAKGVLAERAGLAMEEAFERLRTYARRSSRRLSDVAQALLEGRLTPENLQTPEADVPGLAGAD